MSDGGTFFIPHQLRPLLLQKWRDTNEGKPAAPCSYVPTRGQGHKCAISVHFIESPPGRNSCLQFTDAELEAQSGHTANSWPLREADPVPGLGEVERAGAPGLTV